MVAEAPAPICAYWISQVRLGCPAPDPVYNLVYAGDGADVVLTMCDGRVIYRAAPAADRFEDATCAAADNGCMGSGAAAGRAPAAPVGTRIQGASANAEWPTIDVERAKAECAARTARIISEL